MTQYSDENLTVVIKIVITYSSIGVKKKTVIFGYRELFSKFYQNLVLHRNSYKKYGNKIDRIIENGNSWSHFRPFFTADNEFGNFSKKY
jgi:hypothetical protein